MAKREERLLLSATARSCHGKDLPIYTTQGASVHSLCKAHCANLESVLFGSRANQTMPRPSHNWPPPANAQKHRKPSASLAHINAEGNANHEIRGIVTTKNKNHTRFPRRADKLIHLTLPPFPRLPARQTDERRAED